LTVLSYKKEKGNEECKGSNFGSGRGNQKGFGVEALRVDDPTIALGVNTRKDFKRVIQIMKEKR